MERTGSKGMCASDDILQLKIMQRTWESKRYHLYKSRRKRQEESQQRTHRQFIKEKIQMANKHEIKFNLTINFKEIQN